MKQVLAALAAFCVLLGGCAPRNTSPVQEQGPESGVSQESLQGAASEAVPESSHEEKNQHESVPESQPETAPQEGTAEESQPEAPEQEGPQPPQEMPEAGKTPDTSGAAEQDGDWMLILANYDHPIGDYEPELEVVVEGYPYQMDVRVAGIMRQMIADAKAQGVELLICSAYRPYSSQERNFNNSVQSYIAQGYSEQDATALTKRLIAEPGKSEHQTGLAADIVTPSYQMLDSGYAQTEAAKWLLEHAPSYGFILRYPADKTEITQIDFEPWHYRYVGVEAAKEISEKGICLEEYLGQA